MNNLQNLQSAFKRYLLEENNSIAAQIISTTTLSSDERLAIYGNAYSARLIETLANDYSALNYLLGTEEFNHLSLAYIKAFPSTNSSLRWFGQHLPQFLADHENYSCTPYLAELAKFEWTFIDTFDAQDATVATIEDAANIPPESWPGLHMTLHPSAHWMNCSWNCLALWQAMKNESEPPKPELMVTQVSYLIWRKGTNTQYRSLHEMEAAVLSLVAKQAEFTELCNALTQWINMEETALQAASYFKTWLTEGLISHINY